MNVEKKKIVSGESLKKGTTRSCGCLLKEKKKGKKPKKYNKFKDCGDYFTFYTNKGFFTLTEKILIGCTMIIIGIKIKWDMCLRVSKGKTFHYIDS